MNKTQASKNGSACHRGRQPIRSCSASVGIHIARDRVEPLLKQIEPPLGVNTVFEEGKFYHQPQLQNFLYYCEKIEGESATMLLLKSYQHGKLVRMQLKEPLGSSKYYVEITGEAEIERSKELYEEFVEHRGVNPPQASSTQVMIWVS